MITNAPDITITSLETIKAYDITTGNFEFMLDELQNCKLAQSEEKTPITGKAGRKLSSLKKDKSVKISGTNGLISSGLMSAQTGGEFTSDKAIVKWTDYLKVTSNKATTTYKAVGTPNTEITALYIKGADGTLGKKLEQASGSPSSGQFKYTAGSKGLEFFASEIEDGTEIMVDYERSINANTLANDSDKYSKRLTLYIDALGEDKCANVYRVQIFVPKADFDGNFELSMGDGQSVHAFEAEALAGACGTSGSYWTYTVFGENAADAE